MLWRLPKHLGSPQQFCDSQQFWDRVSNFGIPSWIDHDPPDTWRNKYDTCRFPVQLLSLYPRVLPSRTGSQAGLAAIANVLFLSRVSVILASLRKLPNSAWPCSVRIDSG